MALGIISWSNDGNRPQHDLQPSQQHSMHPKLQVQKIAITRITKNDDYISSTPDKTYQSREKFQQQQCQEH